MTYFFNGGVEPPYPGEDRHARPEPQGRDLRPGPGDARGRGHRRARRGHRARATTTSSSPTTPTPTWSGTRGGGRRPSPRSRSSTAASVGSSPRSRAWTPTTRPRPAPLLAITADHGNADELRDAAGNAVTAHSLNPVPFVLVGRAARGVRPRRRRPGRRRADPARVRRAAALGGDDRPIAHPVIASVAVSIGGHLTRGPPPGHRPDPGEHRAHRRHPAAGPRHRPVRARSVAIRPSTAAGAAWSAGSGSSRSSCWSCSWSSRWPRSSSPRAAA